MNNVGRRRHRRGGARLPQRRHRVARSRTGCGSWSAGRRSRTSALAGLQLLDGDGRSSTAAWSSASSGFADHLFQGMRPASDSLFGSTDWYRNVLSVTAACVASGARSSTGSAASTSASCSAAATSCSGSTPRFPACATCARRSSSVRHLESATRGRASRPATSSPAAGATRRWLVGGDPYFSPSLSLRRPPPDAAARESRRRWLERPRHARPPLRVFRQTTDEEEIAWLADDLPGRRHAATAR